MRNTLTSIAEHSDWLEEMPISMKECWILHRKRVDFGKQPLAIWQFVPCKLVDGEWVVLTKSTMSNKTCEDDCNHRNCVSEMNECIEYQEAKSRCIFEGFEIKREFWADNTHVDYIQIGNDREDKLFRSNNDKEWYSSNVYDFKTIEDLVKYSLELTASAIKELGLTI